MKRVFLIVLDSLGIGAMPDSESFGDVGPRRKKTNRIKAEDQENETIERCCVCNRHSDDA